MPVRNPRTLIIGAALALAAPGAVAAPKAEKPVAASKTKLDLPSLQKSLESGEESQALAALSTIAGSADPAGAPLVEQLLGRGASVAVLGSAIETLGVLAQPSSGATLAPYAQHRTAEVRRAALRALIATKSPLAGEVLRKALRGSDAPLRAIAARGLGELGVRSAVADLFSILPKDVAEAAQSLGRLCVGAECERLTELLGKLRFEVMESAIVPLLLRPQAEVPDELKLKVIERLRRLATTPANQLLQTALAKFPPDGSPKVRQGLERALKGYSAVEDSK
ncbi:MAG: HEAT repeat domain-containing protein [Myxococcales bacterium]|nr:MAG: HEAT repeat domain-containing protein [Myxococcales bacterium]